MRGMQKIYKRDILENKVALSITVAVSFAVTIEIVLTLLGARAYWFAGILMSICGGVVYWRYCEP